MSKAAVQWSPNIPWQKDLLIEASSFKLDFLFDNLPVVPLNRVPSLKPGQYAESKDGQWRYVVQRLEKGQKPSTLYGNKKGKVEFTDDIATPSIWERQRDGSWDLWMSLTPSEMFTLRGGVRRAKGHTIVAGLGMGWQLMQVAKRSQVTEVTVIEKSQSLVDWLWPRITARLRSDLKVNLVVEDAIDALPKIQADVALIDIFPFYGGNDFELDRMKKKAPQIKSWWGWGTSQIYDNTSYIPSFLFIVRR